MSYIKSYKNQNYLIPPNLKDLFSKDHVCYMIEQIANDLDYSKFDEMYAGAGHPAYHPSINVKLLLMAYIDGIKSSRRIAKNAQENVVYIYLAEKTQPDFRTISDFRKDNQDFIKNVFKQVNSFALDQGLIDLSHLMIDGTSIKADANNEKVIDAKTLDKLDKYIDKVIKEGIKIDEEEDKIYKDRGFHELPKDLTDSEKRRPIVRKIIKKINDSIKKGEKKEVEKIKSDLQNIKQVVDEKGLNKYSFVDPDSKFMLNKKKGYELSYNAQLVVEKNGLIISNDVINKGDDRNQLVANVNRVEEDFGELREGTRISADAGYVKGKDMEKLEDKKFDLYIPVRNIAKITDKDKFKKSSFTYDPEKDVYVCPMNKILKNVGTYFDKSSQQNRTQFVSKKKECGVCKHKLECCKKQKRKKISATPYDQMFNRIKEKLNTEEGWAIYNLRKQTVERSIGDIKQNKSFRSFLLRGLKKVKSEFNLVCIAHNLVLINNKLNMKRAMMSIDSNC